MTTTLSQSGDCQNSVLSRKLHPPKVQTVKNQFLQDHHNIPKQKLLKFNFCKTNEPSQSINYEKSVVMLKCYEVDISC